MINTTSSSHLVQKHAKHKLKILKLKINIVFFYPVLLLCFFVVLFFTLKLSLFLLYMLILHDPMIIAYFHN